MTTCRSCDAPILWAISAKSGRRMPLDADTTLDGVRFRIDDHGTAVTVTDGPGHASHFSTCPNANTHRRPR